MKDRRFRVLFVLSVLLLLACEAAGRLIATDAGWFPMAETIVTRVIGSLIFVALIRRIGYPVLGKPAVGREERGHAAVIVLACAVALNNLPVIGLVSGKARITASPPTILLFAVECAAVGCFEELAFRGFLFPYCAERLRGKKHPAFLSALISSAVFGLVHLVNLLSGASPGAVLMQIGYSFLIGGLCVCVLLASGSVWAAAAGHAVYNFCGTILSRFGEGLRWDRVTVWLTAGLGLVVTAVMLGFLSGSYFGGADRALERVLPDKHE